MALLIVQKSGKPVDTVNINLLQGFIHLGGAGFIPSTVNIYVIAMLRLQGMIQMLLHNSE